MLLLRLCTLQTTLDCKMLSSPDTLQILLTRLAFMVVHTILESTILDLPYLTDYWCSCNQNKIFWSACLLYCDLSHYHLLCHNKYFKLLQQCYGQVQTSCNPSIITPVILHMTWIFGSFLVTVCALTSCHIVISKQGDGSMLGLSGPTGV